MSRKIKVYSTSGKTNVDIQTEATTFGELKGLLSQNSISYSNMKVVVGENKHTLESDNAILPDGDFTLFLMPKKTKSGAGERAAFYQQIKNFIEKDGDKARNHFNSGKNYTNKGTDELGILLSKYKGTKTHFTPTTNVVDVVTSKSISKESSHTCIDINVIEISVLNLGGALEDYDDNNISGDELSDYVRDSIFQLQAEISRVKNNGKAPSVPEKSEKDILDEQARNLAREFDDVSLY